MDKNKTDRSRKKDGTTDEHGAFIAPCLIADLEAFKKVFDALPYSVWINAPDGLTLYLNEAGFKQRSHSKEFLKTFNLFDDPNVAAMVPLEKLRRVLNGETVFFQNVRVPLEALIQIQGTKPDLDALYEDITVFPVMEDGRVKYAVTLQVPCRVYKGKIEIERAKEYIDENWREKFDAEKVVKASGFSRAYFLRQFKNQAGMTPHEYYISVKLDKLKKKLCDPALSITAAFSECGLDYNGYFAGVFKEKVGLSPSEYREECKKSK